MSMSMGLITSLPIFGSGLPLTDSTYLGSATLLGTSLSALPVPSLMSRMNL